MPSRPEVESLTGVASGSSCLLGVGLGARMRNVEKSASPVDASGSRVDELKSKVR